MSRPCVSTAILIATMVAAVPAAAQTAVAGATPISAAAQPAPATVTPPAAVAAGIKPPADYVIGVDDALEVLYWQDKDMSAAVVVRPDGNISLPLLNEVKAAGLTPEELRKQVAEAATKFVEEPTVSVVVKAINSRKVYVTGMVAKPGTVPLMDRTTVLQMIATVGGLNEYAKAEEITIIRSENGKEVVKKFNYKDVVRGKRLEQNIELKPGDVIAIP
jgi:polysaccharide biosynthesis/export protein